MMQSENREIGCEWYALRATYHRERKAKEMLDALSITSFVPMQLRSVTLRGKSKAVMTPVISNLIFVYATSSRVKELQVLIPFLQYMYHMQEGRRVPIVVPDEQMSQFIRVVESQKEDLLFLDEEQVSLSKGTRVEITDGNFKGLEGTLVKLKGQCDKRVLIRVEGVLSVALTSVDSKFVRVVPKRSQLKL